MTTILDAFLRIVTTVIGAVSRIVQSLWQFSFRLLGILVLIIIFIAYRFRPLRFLFSLFRWLPSRRRRARRHTYAHPDEELQQGDGGPDRIWKPGDSIQFRNTFAKDYVYLEDDDVSLEDD